MLVPKQVKGRNLPGQDDPFGTRIWQYLSLEVS
jgi:hypothetical protein